MRHKISTIRKAVRVPLTHLYEPADNSLSAEMQLWKHLRTRQLSGVRFRRQQTIGQYIADFYSPEANLVIEIVYTANEAESDFHKDSLFTELGMRIIHITSEEIASDIDLVIDEIDSIVKEGRSSRINH